MSNCRKKKLELSTEKLHDELCSARSLPELTRVILSLAGAKPAFADDCANDRVTSSAIYDWQTGTNSPARINFMRTVEELGFDRGHASLIRHRLTTLKALENTAEPFGPLYAQLLSSLDSPDLSSGSNEYAVGKGRIEWMNVSEKVLEEILANCDAAGYVLDPRIPLRVAEAVYEAMRQSAPTTVAARAALHTGNYLRELSLYPASILHLHQAEQIAGSVGDQTLALDAMHSRMLTVEQASINGPANALREHAALCRAVEQAFDREPPDRAVRLKRENELCRDGLRLLLGTGADEPVRDLLRKHERINEELQLFEQAMNAEIWARAYISLGDLAKAEEQTYRSEELGYTASVLCGFKLERTKALLIATRAERGKSFDVAIDRLDNLQMRTAERGFVNSARTILRSAESLKFRRSSRAFSVPD